MSLMRFLIAINSISALGSNILAKTTVHLWAASVDRRRECWYWSMRQRHQYVILSRDHIA